ncbi:hypothetical protein P9578_27125 [Brevibacillus choshinensis]|uniref:hypothetical protein n=1 Tax=Brevibacillus choshinensis TaxID=54911 RepID=UPI002E213066|nr:hypothetical protein [Brevibacillus choshinensis]
MAKRSKWLKWKIGGGLIVSLAVVFQVAKADPAFGKAVQAAQDNDDSFDPKEDALADQDQTQAEEKPVEEWEHKVSQASVETVLSPAATTPVKNAVTPKKQPIKHSVPKAVASSKPSKSEGKQVVSFAHRVSLCGSFPAACFFINRSKERPGTEIPGQALHQAVLRV